VCPLKLLIAELVGEFYGIPTIIGVNLTPFETALSYNMWIK